MQREIYQNIESVIGFVEKTCYIDVIVGYSQVTQKIIII